MDSEEIRQGESREFGDAPRDREAFVGLIDAIKRHNEDHTPGKMVANMLIGTLKTEDDSKSEEVITSADKQSMDRELIDIKNEKTLKVTGLSLTPIRANTVMWSSGGDTDSVGELRVHIEDGDAFIAFMDKLKPGMINENLEKALEQVINDLVLEAYEMEERPDDFAFEFLTNANKIVSGFNKLGIKTKSLDELTEISSHINAKDSREFIGAKKIGLYQDIGGENFGPSKWQTDTTKEGLTKRWDEVIVLLNKTKNNPNADTLFKDLLKRAQDSLNYAVTDLPRIMSTYESYGEGFHEILERFSLELIALASSEK